MLEAMAHGQHGIQLHHAKERNDSGKDVTWNVAQRRGCDNGLGFEFLVWGHHGDRFGHGHTTHICDTGNTHTHTHTHKITLSIIK